MPIKIGFGKNFRKLGGSSLGRLRDQIRIGGKEGHLD